MFEAQILIPLADNDGDVFTAEHFASFDSIILESFIGFTQLPVNAVGGWMNADGVVFSDESRVYVIGLASLADGGKFVALARFAKAYFLQEAILIRYLGVIEII